jgi:hypothetical protein
MNQLELIAFLQADYNKNGAQEVLFSDTEAGVGVLEVLNVRLTAEGGWLKGMLPEEYMEAKTMVSELEELLADEAVLKVQWKDLVFDADGNAETYWIEQYPDVNAYRQKSVQPQLEQMKSQVQAYESARQLLMLKIAETLPENLEKLRAKSMEATHDEGNHMVS